jgi:hypothetical protein
LAARFAADFDGITLVPIKINTQTFGCPPGALIKAMTSNRRLPINYFEQAFQRLHAYVHMYVVECQLFAAHALLIFFKCLRL